MYPGCHFLSGTVYLTFHRAHGAGEIILSFFNMGRLFHINKTGTI